MPVSNSVILGYIAQAQRAQASYMLTASRLEIVGEDPINYYLKSRYISAAIRVLQNANNGLTNLEKERIIHCMIECGEIATFGNTPIVFPTSTTTPVPFYNIKLTDLTDGPLGSLVGNECKVPTVNHDGLAWSFKKVGFQGTVLFVSPDGTTGEGSKGDIMCHYKTITAAQTDASSGDTIVIMPGTYSDSGLGKSGVTYHFLPGANISSASNIWTITTAIAYRVTGLGSFTCTGAGIFIFNIGHASADFYCEFLDCTTTGTAKFIKNIAGKSYFKGRKYVPTGFGAGAIELTGAACNFQLSLTEPISYSSLILLTSLTGVLSGSEIVFNCNFKNSSAGRICTIAATSTGGSVRFNGDMQSSSIVIDTVASSAMTVESFGKLTRTGTGDNPVASLLGGGTFIQRGRVTNAGTTVNGHGFTIGTTVSLVIEDATIKLANTGASAIHAASATSAVIYNCRSNAAAHEANVAERVNSINLSPLVI